MLDIMNAALLSRGHDEIVSVNDGSNEYRVLARNWPLIVEAELETGRYSFTRHEEALASRINGKFGFTDGFLVPANALHVRRVWIEADDGERDRPEWTQDERAVYLDSPSGCVIEYVAASEPDVWTANFARGVQYRLEALIARAFQEEAAEGRDREEAAEIAFQQARTLSSQSRSAKPAYRKGAIARARHGSR